MKEFIFEVERRVYGWMKDRLSIEAETPEEALEKLKEMAEDGKCIYFPENQEEIINTNA